MAQPRLTCLFFGPFAVNWVGIWVGKPPGPREWVQRPGWILGAADSNSPSIITGMLTPAFERPRKEIAKVGERLVEGVPGFAWVAILLNILAVVRSRRQSGHPPFHRCRWRKPSAASPVTLVAW